MQRVMNAAQRRASRRPYDDDVDALGHARDEQRMDVVGVTDCDVLGWTTRSSSPSAGLGAGGWCGPDGQQYADVL